MPKNYIAALAHYNKKIYSIISTLRIARAVEKHLCGAKKHNKATFEAEKQF